jgi:multidrug transporter EmrE-like cation transporter
VIFHHAGGLAGLALAVLTSPYPYLTVACSAIALLIFQTGLQRCRVSIVGPVSNITGSIFFMIAGTWLFSERLPANPVELALRLGGIALAGAAVVVLSRQPAATPPTGVPAASAAPSGEAGPAGGAAAVRTA